MYAPGSINVEFPTSINLPPTGSVVNVIANGDTKQFFKISNGIV